MLPPAVARIGGVCASLKQAAILARPRAAAFVPDQTARRKPERHRADVDREICRAIGFHHAVLQQGGTFVSDDERFENCRAGKKPELVKEMGPKYRCRCPVGVIVE